MIVDILYAIVTSALFFSLIHGQRKAGKTIETLTVRLETLEGGRARQMADITQTLTDPAMLDAELEKSANLTEMRRAKRTTLPRPDAGPPAVVKRLNIDRG